MSLVTRTQMEFPFNRLDGADTADTGVDTTVRLENALFFMGILFYIQDIL